MTFLVRTWIQYIGWDAQVGSMFIIGAFLEKHWYFISRTSNQYEPHIKSGDQVAYDE